MQASLQLQALEEIASTAAAAQLQQQLQPIFDAARSGQANEAGHAPTAPQGSVLAAALQASQRLPVEQQLVVRCLRCIEALLMLAYPPEQRQALRTAAAQMFLAARAQDEGGASAGPRTYPYTPRVMQLCMILSKAASEGQTPQPTASSQHPAQPAPPLPLWSRVASACTTLETAHASDRQQPNQQHRPAAQRNGKRPVPMTDSEVRTFVEDVWEQQLQKPLPHCADTLRLIVSQLPSEHRRALGAPPPPPCDFMRDIESLLKKMCETRAKEWGSGVYGTLVSLCDHDTSVMYDPWLDHTWSGPVAEPGPTRTIQTVRDASRPPESGGHPISPYRGVYWHPPDSAWRVEIPDLERDGVNCLVEERVPDSQGNEITISSWQDPIQAARLWDRCALDNGLLRTSYTAHNYLERWLWWVNNPSDDAKFYLELNFEFEHEEELRRFQKWRDGAGSEPHPDDPEARVLDPLHVSDAAREWARKDTLDRVGRVREARERLEAALAPPTPQTDVAPAAARRAENWHGASSALSALPSRRDAAAAAPARAAGAATGGAAGREQQTVAADKGAAAAGPSAAAPHTSVINLGGQAKNNVRFKIRFNNGLSMQLKGNAKQEPYKHRMPTVAQAAAKEAARKAGGSAVAGTSRKRAAPARATAADAAAPADADAAARNARAPAARAGYLSALFSHARGSASGDRQARSGGSSGANTAPPPLVGVRQSARVAAQASAAATAVMLAEQEVDQELAPPPPPFTTHAYPSTAAGPARLGSGSLGRAGSKSSATLAGAPGGSTKFILRVPKSAQAALHAAAAANADAATPTAGAVAAAQPVLDTAVGTAQLPPADGSSGSGTDAAAAVAATGVKSEPGTGPLGLRAELGGGANRDASGGSPKRSARAGKATTGQQSPQRQQGSPKRSGHRIPGTYARAASGTEDAYSDREADTVPARSPRKASLAALAAANAAALAGEYTDAADGKTRSLPSPRSKADARGTVSAPVSLQGTPIAFSTRPATARAPAPAAPVSVAAMKQVAAAMRAKYDQKKGTGAHAAAAAAAQVAHADSTGDPRDARAAATNSENGAPVSALNAGSHGGTSGGLYVSASAGMADNDRITPPSTHTHETPRGARERDPRLMGVAAAAAAVAAIDGGFVGEQRSHGATASGASADGPATKRLRMSAQLMPTSRTHTGASSGGDARRTPPPLAANGAGGAASVGARTVSEASGAGTVPSPTTAECGGTAKHAAVADAAQGPTPHLSPLQGAPDRASEAPPPPPPPAPTASQAQPSVYSAGPSAMYPHPAVPAPSGGEWHGHHIQPAHAHMQAAQGHIQPSQTLPPLAPLTSWPPQPPPQPHAPPPGFYAPYSVAPMAAPQAPQMSQAPAPYQVGVPPPPPPAAPSYPGFLLHALHTHPKYQPSVEYALDDRSLLRELDAVAPLPPANAPFTGPFLPVAGGPAFAAVSDAVFTILDRFLDSFAADIDDDVDTTRETAEQRFQRFQLRDMVNAMKLRAAWLRDTHTQDGTLAWRVTEAVGRLGLCRLALRDRTLLSAADHLFAMLLSLRLHRAD